MGKMLSMKYLLEEARNLELPILKKRAILREYLQTIILNSIYKGNFSKVMFFVGGTALRFFYNLPRFSEDLDFNTPGLKKTEFKQIIQEAKKNLSLEGFSPRIFHKQRGSLLIANLEFKDVMKQYGITDSRGESMMIKIEINQPRWNLNHNPQVISLYGYNFSAILMSEGALLSEKLCALLNRRRGRYIYDILFMLRKGFPFDRKVLDANDISDEPKKVLLNYLQNLSKKELKKLAEQVKPFLFKEDDVELILKAPLYAEKFLARY